jgi:hypothetical protein
VKKRILLVEDSADFREALDIALPRLDGFYVAEVWKRDPASAISSLTPAGRFLLAVVRNKTQPLPHAGQQGSRPAERSCGEGGKRPKPRMAFLCP